jgi:hypothetical protein
MGGNVGFIEKLTAKLEKWKAIYFDEEWFLGIDSESSSEWHCNNILDDTMTIFGMTIFFLILKHNMLRKWLGWRCDNIWIFTYKFHKEKYDFNLAIKQKICYRGNMKNWWNNINLYSQFSCNCFCIISIT